MLYIACRLNYAYMWVSSLSSKYTLPLFHAWYAWLSVTKKLTFAFYSTHFSDAFVSKQYILEQRCVNGHRNLPAIGTRWCNVWPCTPTLRTTMHSVTERRTDGRHDDANSRSLCIYIAVRSAKTTACMSVVYQSGVYANPPMKGNNNRVSLS